MAGAWGLTGVREFRYANLEFESSTSNNHVRRAPAYLRRGSAGRILIEFSSGVLTIDRKTVPMLHNLGTRT